MGALPRYLYPLAAPCRSPLIPKAFLDHPLIRMHPPFPNHRVMSYQNPKTGSPLIHSGSLALKSVNITTAIVIHDDEFRTPTHRPRARLRLGLEALHHVHENAVRSHYRGSP